MQQAKAMSDSPVRIEALSPAEQLQLLERLWDSLSRTPGNVPLTEPQRAELDQRLDDLDRDLRQGQAPGVPWEEVVSFLPGCFQSSSGRERGVTPARTWPNSRAIWRHRGTQTLVLTSSQTTGVRARRPRQRHPTGRRFEGHHLREGFTVSDRTSLDAVNSHGGKWPPRGD